MCGDIVFGGVSCVSAAVRHRNCESPLLYKPRDLRGHGSSAVGRRRCGLLFWCRDGRSIERRRKRLNARRRYNLTSAIPPQKSQFGTNTFQANLTAAPIALLWISNSSTEFWSDNGSVPGPLIDVYEGDTVRIRFDNKLAQPSTIHWHGWPVLATQDRNPMNPVAAGDGRYYKFTLALGSAGTYRYHPHAHGVTAGQVHRGLSGAFIVRPRIDPVP